MSLGQTKRSGQPAAPRGVTVTRNKSGLTIRYARRSIVDLPVLMFGVMLLAVAAEFLFQLVRAAESGLRGWFWLAFGGLGVALFGIGLYTIYRGLAQMVNSTVIHVSMHGVRVISAPLPLPGEKPLVVKAVRRVECVEEKVYLYNRRGVREVELYNLCAESWERGQVELLNGLGDAETVRYIAEEIEGWLSLNK